MYKRIIQITLIDDSIPFDGFTPANRPLGGAEKAFASLAGALARRGHEVHVLNRARYGMVVEGAHWDTMDKGAPAMSDVLIAFRKPALLSLVRLARQRVLWLTGTSRQLAPALKVVENVQPEIVLLGQTHLKEFKLPKGMQATSINPGVRNEFLMETPTELHERPTAVMTAHPLLGMDWALDLWRDRIISRVAQPRLVLVSAVLKKGLAGQEIPENIVPIMEKVRDMAALGVEVVAPGADSGMGKLYRSARLHLYPASRDDMACWTLMESQACGLPAVVRPLGAAAERIEDGQTGFVAKTDEDFAEKMIRLLNDDELFWTMNRDAKLVSAGKTWDLAASQFEAVFK